MASKEFNETKPEVSSTEMPKHKQLIRMLSFRVVPAYFKEIEKVAGHKKMTVSKLIRSYIKEGMKRDKEITGSQDTNFRVD
jgi:predicted DNA-binding ribbon-helix-helix protein